MLTDYRTDLTHNPEVTAMMEPDTDDPEENKAPLFQGLGLLSINLSTLIPDSEINSKVRSLNTKQK